MASSELFQALFERAFSGNNHEAFDALFIYVLRYLFGFDFGLSYQDREDIAQEILLKAWVGWNEEDLRTHPNLERWIWKVAFTSTVDFWRKWSKNKKLVRLGDIDFDDNEGKSYNFVSEEHISVTNVEELPEQSFEQLEEQLEKKYYVLHALSQVSDLNRPFLTECLVQKRKQPEIAEQFHCSVKTVQRRIEAGKHEFQQAYEALVAEPSTLERRGV